MDAFYKQILWICCIPIYALLIPLEIILSHLSHQHRYSTKETLINVYFNVISAAIDLIMRGFALWVLVGVVHFDLALHLPFAAYWLILFLGEDLLFWLEHYVDHSSRFFWAMHVTHHSSTEFNLSTGFRSSVFMPFYRYLYFIPLAWMGFRPADIFFMYAITQLYGILVHTQAIKNVPRWIGAVLVTPSHHQVHHASNTPYLDRNMGMVLIIWDRLFGTFTEEMKEEKPKFGLTKPLPAPHHPIKVITHEWEEVYKDMKKDVSLWNKIKYLFYKPGWSHDGSSKTSAELRKEWHGKLKHTPNAHH